MGHRHTIPVSDSELYNELNELRKQKSCTWTELVTELVNDAEISDLAVSGEDGKSKRRARGMEAARNIIKDNTNGDVKTATLKIIDQIEDIEYNTQRSGVVLAASLEYLTRILLDNKKTQSELSNKYGCHRMSIRDCYQELYDQFLKHDIGL